MCFWFSGTIKRRAKRLREFTHAPLLRPFVPVAAVFVGQMKRPSFVQRVPAELFQEERNGGSSTLIEQIQRPLDVKRLREHVAATTDDHPVDSAQIQIYWLKQGFYR